MIEKSLDDSTKACARATINNAATSRAAIDGFDLSAYDFGSGPLHVLTNEASNRRTVKGVCSHVRSTRLPDGAFRKLDKGIYIASPELCFYEMAQVLPLSKLIELGFLFCGTYTMNPSAENPNKRKKLSTVRKLCSFAQRMDDLRGKGIVTKALRYVLEGSASPRETKTAMLLTLPTHLGGYNIARPVLNYEIRFSKSERLLFGKQKVVLDLYWPDSHFGIEYDGYEHHSDMQDISNDRKKDSELSFKGIDVVRVDKQQLSSPYQVYVLARKVQQAMGIRHYKATSRQWENRQALFNTIMRGYTGWR